jgi:ThiF family
LSRDRWWSSPEHSVEDEQARFADAELDFELDQELFRTGEVVVFRGNLQLGEQAAPAMVVYPPAYDAGRHPIVVAPELDIGRHRSPNGALCLDHPVLGEMAPMCGAEAVERAERLWWLWEHDRVALHDEEADAPDPWGNYVEYAEESALLIDLREEAGECGYLDLAVSSLSPFRGSLLGLRQTHPEPREIAATPTVAALLAGERRIEGVWKRLDAPPPDPRLFALYNWLQSEHSALLKRATDDARASSGGPPTPALLGFVFPDEGPARGAFHDAWLFFLIRGDGQMEAPRPIALRGEEAWVRQPNLAAISSKTVAILGAGALGSQIAALLARAGVGRFLLVDHDVVTAGNRVRHELDLADVGRFKTAALADRLRRINPWCEVREQPQGFGGLNAPMLEAIQTADDQLASRLTSADLIVNASADSVAGFHCAKLARAAESTVLHAWVGPGAWGARILIQHDGAEPSGCTECLARWQESGGAEVPPLPEDPDPVEILEAGCADPSFTGPGFELTEAAAAVARVAVQILGEGSEAAYPPVDFDLLTLGFRDRAVAHPESRKSRLPAHPDCSICGG